ncbi:MAG TPA: alpha/beta fold hydrolase [Polyangiales bacterium]|jgi:triacylglycerol lipase|nr:alpha/beta fold hydrolase [Polyangiales bacterium]
MLDHAQLTLALLALLAIAAGAYVVARRRARRLRIEAPRTERLLPAAEPAVESSEPPAPELPAEPSNVARHPIVLAHGFMGFDAIGLGNLREEYFRGVRAHLQARGHRVHVVRVSPIAGIRRRAEQLAEQLEALDAERVNIVAHSMGGLDARYAISRLGVHRRVASLTTIGTPHHGTPLADGTAYLAGFNLALKLMDSLGADLAGFQDLGTKRMQAFNDAVPDVDEVAYASYSGWLPKGASVHQLLLPTFALLHRTVGNNDGIVPADSQSWGQSLGAVAADHWAQIGWSNGFDVKTFYEAVALGLARRGF